MVKTNARHLLELINDVLDISKIEAGRLEVKGESFEVRSSIERVIALVKPFAEKKGLTLTTAQIGNIGAMNSDRRRFEQILLNLLNNAIKFTDAGSVTLPVETLSDFHSDDTPRPALCVRIRDT